MTRPTHQAAAAFTTAAVLLISEPLLPQGDTVMYLAAVAVSAWAALLPDADTSQSYVSRRLWLLRTIIFMPVILFRLLMRLLAVCFRGRAARFFREAARCTGHRGLFHWPVTWAVIFLATGLSVFDFKAAVWYTPCVPYVFIGAVCGVFSHIIGDTFFGGIALLAPFYRKRVRFSPARTGSLAETLTLCILIVTDFFILKQLFIV